MGQEVPGAALRVAAQHCMAAAELASGLHHSPLLTFLSDALMIAILPLAGLATTIAVLLVERSGTRLGTLRPYTLVNGLAALGSSLLLFTIITCGGGGGNRGQGGWQRRQQQLQRQWHAQSPNQTHLRPTKPACNPHPPWPATTHPATHPPGWLL